ncbi:MAG: PDZ domain-containing protein [Planctomycetes bacterium]|nr:PDZ domain-containing protein [Planctomycetota bacterium]
MKRFIMAIAAVVFVVVGTGMAEDVKLGGPGKAVLGIEIKPDFQVGSMGRGLEVTHVVSGSLAEKIGVKKGDLITSINGKTLTNFEDLVTAVVDISPTKKNSITVARKDGGKTFRFDSEDPFYKDDNFIFLVIGKHNKYASKTDILGAVTNSKEMRNIKISNVLAVIFCEKCIGAVKTTVILGFIRSVEGNSVDFLI